MFIHYMCNFLSFFLLYFYKNKSSMMRNPIWVETFFLNPKAIKNTKNILY